MNVCLDSVSHLVVDDQTNILYIDTTTRKICGDQNV